MHTRLCRQIHGTLVEVVIFSVISLYGVNVRDFVGGILRWYELQGRTRSLVTSIVVNGHYGCLGYEAVMLSVEQRMVGSTRSMRRLNFDFTMNAHN